MEKFNNQKKEDRRDFIKKAVKGILGISTIGGLAYVNKKINEKKQKELEKELEKELAENISIIQKESEKINKEIEDYKIFYEDLAKEIKTFMEQNKEISIFDKKLYLKQLIKYNDKLEIELKIINTKNKEVDLISESINKIMTKQKLNKEKENLLNKIFENNLKSKLELLEIEKQCFNLKLDLLNLIEEIYIKLNPDKKLA